MVNAMMVLSEAMNIIIFGVIVSIFIITLILKSIKVVPKSKALVVFQLGRLTKVCGPGFHMLIPVIEMGKFIDVGKQTFELKLEKVLILDSSPVKTTSVIEYLITDPAKAILNVDDYKSALTLVSETYLRRFCSEITLTELLTDRPKIQERVREAVARETREWGLQIDGFVINFVDVAEEVQNELRRKAESERLRRLMSEN
jgi:regulator of protease activity HflC (stomatin/prohibitin superfamily)